MNRNDHNLALTNTAKSLEALAQEANTDAAALRAAKMYEEAQQCDQASEALRCAATLIRTRCMR